MLTTVEGKGHRIVVTGFGDHDTGGGLFVLEPDGASRIDWLASTGLAVDADAGRVARLLRDPGAPGSSGELLVYDRDGVVVYRRLTELCDAHGAVWFGGDLVVVSTSRNALVRIGAQGNVTGGWSAPSGTGDAWHVNCLAADGDRLLATAFGRFRGHREWNRPGAADGAGFIFDIETAAPVATGLTHPHHPCRVGDEWIVCQSRAGLLTVFDECFRKIRDVALGGFTRGLAWDDEHVYAGVSGRRHDPGGGLAAVVVLARGSLRELARFELPCREVFDIAVVEDALLSGLEAGFRTNPLRTGEDDQHELLRAAGVAPLRLWASGDPLPETACRTRLKAELPVALQAGETVTASWTLANHGGAPLASLDPNPVRVAARWQAPDGSVVAESERALLDRPLPPGQSTSGTLVLTAPDQPGEYDLVLAPVQELVRWFDQVDPANGTARRVRVSEAPAPTAGATIWLTGLPASGKTTLAEAVRVECERRAVPAVVVDGDVLRATVSRDLGFDPQSRAEQARRASKIALEAAARGEVAIVALVSPLRAARALVRREHEALGVTFVEAWLSADAATCAARDQRGLWARAVEGELRGFTGWDAPYEPPEHPEAVVPAAEAPEHAARELLALLPGARVQRFSP